MFPPTAVSTGNQLRRLHRLSRIPPPPPPPLPPSQQLRSRKACKKSKVLIWLRKINVFIAMLLYYLRPWANQASSTLPTSGRTGLKNGSAREGSGVELCGTLQTGSWFLLQSSNLSVKLFQIRASWLFRRKEIASHQTFSLISSYSSSSSPILMAYPSKPFTARSPQ